MKKIIGILGLLIFSFQATAIEEEIVKSTINNVTVYSQGAQIYRKANYTVKSGITKIIIDGVSNTIDANSLQVKATGNIIILDSKYSLYYPKPEEINLEGLPLKTRQDIIRLEDSLLIMNYDIQSIQDEIDVLTATKTILVNNGAMRGQGKVNDSINLLKQAIEYYTVKMNEINGKLLILNRKKNEKSITRQKMNERLANLKNFQSKNQLDKINNGPIPRLTITVQATTSATGRLDVSYLVSQAGWVPLYDLRSEISTSQVNLNYKANVYQNTGVSWDDVRLTISTNNPYQNKTLPSLHPWYIDYYAYRQQNYGNAPSSAINNMNTGIVYNQAAKKGYETTMDNKELDAMTSNQFVTVVDHMISAEFQIDLPYTIESNNEQHMVLIKNIDLKANYKYYTVPKLDRSAYLVAQISKLEDLQLVPAKANIFFDGSYIGETYLDPSSLNDTLNLSLGKDPNIIVKRTLLKHECKEKVVGNTIEKTYAYVIEVKNHKASTIEIVVQDQMPITQNSEITIEMIDSDKATYNEMTGLLEWNLKLKTKENKQIKLTYKVKHNKDQNVAL